jgi:hypothetical protein
VAIYKYFNKDTDKIIHFMTGHHWRNKYSNYDEKEDDLYRKKKELENIDNYRNRLLYFWTLYMRIVINN